MKVILNQDVYNLGEEGDVCDVKRGYARNFLLPKHLAFPYTKQYQAIFESRKEAIEQRKEQKRKDAGSLKERLESLEFNFAMPAGDTGKLFGAVTNLTLSEELAKEGFSIERKKIEIPQHTIKMVGNYTVKIKLYEGESATVKVAITKAEDSKKKAAGKKKTEKEPSKKEAKEEAKAENEAKKEEEATGKAEAKTEEVQAEKAEAKTEEIQAEKAEAKTEEVQAEKAEAKTEEVQAEKAEAKDEKPEAKEEPVEKTELNTEAAEAPAEAEETLEKTELNTEAAETPAETEKASDDEKSEENNKEAGE